MTRILKSFPAARDHLAHRVSFAGVDRSQAVALLARRYGCQPITLGPIILRVETAAIYCLSVLSYELLI